MKKRRRIRIVSTLEDLKEVRDAYLGFKAFAFDTETMGERPLDPSCNQVFWLSLAGPGRADVIPFGHPLGEVDVPKHVEKVRQVVREGETKKNGEPYYRTVNRVVDATYLPAPKQLTPRQVFEVLEPVFFGPARKVGHNVKFDLTSLAKYYDGAMPTPPYGDTWIAEHLLWENWTQYSLKVAAQRWLGAKWPKIGSKGVENFPFSEAAAYAIRDAWYTWLLWRELAPFIWKTPNLKKVFQLEMQLTGVLGRMELAGVPIDNEALIALDRVLTDEMDTILANVWRRAGKKINLNSAADKGHYLYDILGKEPPEYTKTGQASTKASVLRMLSGKEVREVERYAELAKLQGTYATGLLKVISPDGHLRTSFRQASTVTGRLSSSGPNLQTMPRPSESKPEASAVRGMFQAPPGHKIVVADYDQIELRVIAHFSQDPTMVRVFREGGDPHANTAAQVFRKAVEDVTKDERALAKTLNFGIAYGAGPKKVAETAGIGVRRAEELVEDFEEQFSTLFKWKRDVIRKAKLHKMPQVHTLLGRVRRLPDLTNHRDDYDRWRAERQAVNAVVQGSAADIMKLGMIRLDRSLRESDLRATLVLTVHDELVLIAPDEEVEETCAVLEEAMLIPDILTVPLAAEAKAGATWREAK